MDVMLNNGTLVSNVKPDDLKRMEELGLIGKSNTASNVPLSNPLTEEVHAVGVKPLL